MLLLANRLQLPEALVRRWAAPASRTFSSLERFSAAEEPLPAAAAAAAPGALRTPASLALQYTDFISTQELDVLAAFLQWA